MVANNYVKVGRLARVLRGPRADKIGVIVSIIDSNRVLLENPQDKSCWRHVQNIKNLDCTRFSVPLKTNASKKTLVDALSKKNVIAKFAKTRTSKQIVAKQAFANSSEFERYQLRVAKRQRAAISRAIFAKQDAATPTSLAAITLAKLEKQAKKYSDKRNAARHQRIKKFMAAKKAKRAGKGKNAGKGKK